MPPQRLDGMPPLQLIVLSPLLNSNYGPTLPVHVAYHCLTMVDDNIAMMIGGYIDEDSGFSERTFYFNFLELSC